MYKLKHRLKALPKRTTVVLTFVILFLLRIGYQVPLPFINADYIKSMLGTATEGTGLSMLTSIMGGSLDKMSLFALSITPYITASIVVQLLGVAFPVIGEWQKEGGDDNKKKLKRFEYLVATGFAAVEAIGLAIAMYRSGAFTVQTVALPIIFSIVWTAGSVFLMFVGNFITEYLFGNGLSLMLAFNILASIPSDIVVINTVLLSGKSIPSMIAIIAGIVVALAALLTYIVLLNEGEHRLRTSSTRSGRGAYNQSVMPIKVNLGGVMPVIFASTLMSMPLLISRIVEMFGKTVNYNTFGGKLLMYMNSSMWFNKKTPIYTLGVLLYILLVYAFAYFYKNISFNATEIANNLKKNGQTIHGIRPGQPTAEYIRKIANRITFIGTSLLIVAMIVPMAVCGLLNIGSLSFTGTSIIIVVSVAIESIQSYIADTRSVRVASLFGAKQVA